MRSVLLPALLAAIGLTAGCRALSKDITETVLAREKANQWRIHYASRSRYELTNKTLEEMEFEGSRHAGNVVVRYQWGLAEQAQCLADQTAALLEAVHARTGVVVSTRSLIYLLRFDERPQNFDITLRARTNEFLLPLFLEVGQESCESIMAQSRSYPYLLVHELVETSLAGRAEGTVLPDLSWGWLVLRVNLNNYTRWFRDGLANYAGLIAHEMVAKEVPSEQKLRHREAILHTAPFSALARIGDRLFSWQQSPARRNESEHYDAALGLFLLIADTYGEQAIRAIVNEIGERKAVDGRDLVEITNRTINADVKQLARDFEFPRIGVEVERMTAALARNKGVEPREGLFIQAVRDKSIAMKAGLQAKDVLTAIGATPVANRLDFELGLFKARKQPTVPLTIQRVGVGAMTLDLSLAKPSTSEKDTSPGKRRNPHEEGGIELSPMSSSS